MLLAKANAATDPPATSLDVGIVLCLLSDGRIPTYREIFFLTKVEDFIKKIYR